ncbi:MAG: alpha/beta hydrolase family protein [Allosphingosinicella sp.]
MRVLLALACLLGAVVAPADLAFASAPDLSTAAQAVAVAGPGLADPPRDPAHPARNRQLLVPSHGEEMNALFLLAAGEGPHPTLLLIHGMPGNERNYDLAQAVRRAGWNVLTLHYRGAWGSPGRFSIAGAIEDADSALDFLRRSDVARDYRVDHRRLVVGGHSMGGLAATLVAAGEPGLAGLLLIDPWNAGLDGAAVHTGGAAARTALEASLDDFGHSLAGATPASIVDEILAHRGDWDLVALAPRLAGRQVLVVTATEGEAARFRPVVAAIRAAHDDRADDVDRVRLVEMETDHSFADHRLALAAETVRWLRELP